MDELYQEEGYVKIPDKTLRRPKEPKLIHCPMGLICVLIKDAYRGTGSNRYSNKVKALYESEGLLCAEVALSYLASTMQTSVPSVQRWMGYLKEWGLVIPHHDEASGEMGIYEVGYWTRVKRRGGELERVNFYHLNEFVEGGLNESVQGGLHESVQPPLHESMQPPLNESMQPPLNESMQHATYATTTQTLPSTDATPARPSGPADRMKTSRAMHILQGESGSNRSTAVGSLTQQRKKEEKAEREKEAAKKQEPLDTTSENAKKVCANFAKRYREILGIPYTPSAQDGVLVDQHFSYDVDLDVMNKATDMYLNNYKKLPFHDGLPGIRRMLHSARWQMLVAAAVKGDVSYLKLVSGGNDKGGKKGDEDTVKRIEDSIKAVGKKKGRMTYEG